MTTIELHASTTGYDEAEAIATVLERAAEAVRTAGGATVNLTDQVTTAGREGNLQQVYWSLHFGA